MRLVLSWVFSCALGLVMGCSASEPPAASPPPPAQIGQVERGRLTAVQAAIKQDGELAGEVIRVTVQGGTVTLEGTVQTLDEKQRAEKITAGVRGVDKVDNRIDVASSGR